MSILDNPDLRIDQAELIASKYAEREEALDKISVELYEAFAKSDCSHFRPPCHSAHFHLITYAFDETDKEWYLFAEWNKSLTFDPHPKQAEIRQILDESFEPTKSDIRTCRIPRLIYTNCRSPYEQHT